MGWLSAIFAGEDVRGPGMVPTHPAQLPPTIYYFHKQEWTPDMVPGQIMVLVHMGWLHSSRLHPHFHKQEWVTPE